MKHNSCINDLTNIENWFYRKIKSGSYIITPLGQLYIDYITNVIDKIMQENHWNKIVLPILQEKDIWLERLKKIDNIYFEFNNLILAPTNEIIANIYYSMDKYLNNKKFYQIHWKFRKELRYSEGMYRTREFLMKDAYSFGTKEEIMKDFEDMKHIYQKIFNILNVDVTLIESDPKEMGNENSKSYEFLNKEFDWEMGEIFYLDKTYSEKYYTGSYGIGITRILAYYIKKIIQDKSPIKVFEYATTDVLKYKTEKVLLIESKNMNFIKKLCLKLNIDFV